MFSIHDQRSGRRAASRAGGKRYRAVLFLDGDTETGRAAARQSPCHGRHLNLARIARTGSDNRAGGHIAQGNVNRRAAIFSEVNGR